MGGSRSPRRVNMPGAYIFLVIRSSGLHAPPSSSCKDLVTDGHLGGYFMSSSLGHIFYFVPMVESMSHMEDVHGSGLDTLR